MVTKLFLCEQRQMCECVLVNKSQFLNAQGQQNRRLLLSNEGFSFFIVYTMGFRLEKTVWNDLLIKENHYVFGEDQQWDWLKLKWNFLKNKLSRRLRGSEEVPAGQTVFFNANLHVNRRPIRWDIQLSFCLLSDSCAETWIWKLKQWP